MIFWKGNLQKKSTVHKKNKKKLSKKYCLAGTLEGIPKLCIERFLLRAIWDVVNSPSVTVAEMAEYQLNEFVVRILVLWIVKNTYFRATVNQ